LRRKLCLEEVKMSFEVKEHLAMEEEAMEQHN